MSQVQLPLQLCVAIRDSWVNADSPVQRSLKELGDIIGIPVSVQFPWPMLWDQLGKHFPDKNVFVPAINDVISSWQQAMRAKLVDEEETAWTDEFLEAIKGQSSLAVRVEVNRAPCTALTWHKLTSSLHLKLPDSAPPYTPNPSAVFNTQLQTLFDPISDEKLDEDWADVTHTPTVRQAPKTFTVFPSLSTLPRPELLFPTTAPYHLILRQTPQSITIEGTHQPSLELLCAYFKKWTRSIQQNPHLSRLQVTLKESAFGMGVLYDSLVVEPNGSRYGKVEMNPVLIIGFIENVLKYQIVTKPMGMDGIYFRREEAFA